MLAYLDLVMSMLNYILLTQILNSYIGAAIVSKGQHLSVHHLLRSKIMIIIKDDHEFMLENLILNRLKNTFNCVLLY